MPSKNAAAPHRSNYAEQDMELATLWQAVRGGLKGLAITAAGIGALTYGALSLMAPRYASESQLEFVAKRNNPFPEAGERPSGPDNATRIDQAAINTHARALLSSDLLLKVAAELKLRNRPEFNSALGSVDMWGRLLRFGGIGGPLAGEPEDERVLAVIRRQIEVAATKETRFIAIRFNSADGKLAADFANLLADTYRASLVSQPVEETSKAVDAMMPKVTQLRREVLDAEADVERYRASSDQFRSGPQNTPVVDQRMAGLQEELLRAEAARNEADARWRTAREMHKSGSSEVLPDVQKSALVQGLIQQRVRLERQIAESSASLLSGHPRMQQLNADVAGLRRQITAEVEKVVQGIEKDARSSAIRVDSVGRQIDALKTRVVSNTGNEARLKELESLARSKRTELERLQKQLEDNRTVVNIRQVPIEAQVIARAMASSTPAYPRKTPSAVLAASAAFILGLAVIITKALISPQQAPLAKREAPRHARAPQREPAFDGPAGDEPPVAHSAQTAHSAQPTRASGAAVQAAAAPDAPLADLAARLVTRTDIATGIRTIVTSDTPASDPLREARSLADYLSGAGKRLLLISWNPTGQNELHTDRTMHGRKPGMRELLAGTASFEDAISRMPNSSIDLIQCGSPSSAPSELLDPDRLNLTLDALDEAYDHIVVAATYDEARDLFEAVEGRFDAAVLVTNAPLPPVMADGSTTYLGFETTGIDVVHTLPALGSFPGSGPRTGSPQQRNRVASTLQAAR